MRLSFDFKPSEYVQQGFRSTYQRMEALGPRRSSQRTLSQRLTTRTFHGSIPGQLHS